MTDDDEDEDEDGNGDGEQRPSPETQHERASEQMASRYRRGSGSLLGQLARAQARRPPQREERPTSEAGTSTGRAR